MEYLYSLPQKRLTTAVQLAVTSTNLSKLLNWTKSRKLGLALSARIKSLPITPKWGQWPTGGEPLFRAPTPDRGLTQARNSQRVRKVRLPQLPLSAGIPFVTCPHLKECATEEEEKKSSQGCLLDAPLITERCLRQKLFVSSQLRLRSARARSFPRARARGLLIWSEPLCGTGCEFRRSWNEIWWEKFTGDFPPGKRSWLNDCVFVPHRKQHVLKERTLIYTNEWGRLEIEAKIEATSLRNGRALLDFVVPFVDSL